MGYIVVCYSHSPVKEWPEVDTKEEAREIINNHPIDHKVKYYPTDILGKVKRKISNFLFQVNLYDPKRKEM